MKNPSEENDSFDLSAFSEKSETVPPKPKIPVSEGPPPYFRPSSPRNYDKSPRSFDKSPRSFRSDRPVWEKPALVLSPELKKLMLLRTEKGRYRESRFLIEGAKNITDTLEITPAAIRGVWVSDGFEDDVLKELLRSLKIEAKVVPVREMAMLSDTDTPQGIIAVANFASPRPDWNTAHAVTLLDGVQDPGNVGAILRTSVALGMDAVVLGKGTCDPYNPKVVRASVASLLRMPIEAGEDLSAKIHFLRTKGFSVVATSPLAKTTLDKAKLRRKVALLFGNEGAGVGPNLMDQADVSVRIPMRGKVESLNVSIAHGILAHELMRLRG